MYDFCIKKQKELTMKYGLLLILFTLSSCFESPKKKLQLDISDLKKVNIEMKDGHIAITKSLDKTEFECKEGAFTLKKESNILKTSDAKVNCVLRVNGVNISVMMSNGLITMDDIDGNVYVKGNTVDLNVFEDDLTDKMRYFFPTKKETKFYFQDPFIEKFGLTKEADKTNVTLDVEQGYARVKSATPGKENFEQKPE